MSVILISFDLRNVSVCVCYATRAGSLECENKKNISTFLIHQGGSYNWIWDTQQNSVFYFLIELS